MTTIAYIALALSLAIVARAGYMLRYKVLELGTVAAADEEERLLLWEDFWGWLIALIGAASFLTLMILGVLYPPPPPEVPLTPYLRYRAPLFLVALLSIVSREEIRGHFRRRRARLRQQKSR